MTNPPTPTMDRWTALETVIGALAAMVEADQPPNVQRNDLDLGAGGVSHLEQVVLPQEFQPGAGGQELADALLIVGQNEDYFLDLIISARSGGGDVVELREALEKIKALAYGGKTWVIASEALAALSRIEAGGGSLPAQGPSVPTGVYVASRASIPERGEMWRNLRASGVKVTSSWIDEDGPGETADFADLWPRIQREVAASEALICYLEPDDFPIKGVLIEIGMALAASIPVRIVAPAITLEGRNFRPLGSWIKHPLVSFHQTIADAIPHPAKSDSRTGGDRG